MGDETLTQACESFLRAKGYSVFPPKNTLQGKGASLLRDHLVKWIQTLMPTTKQELDPVAALIAERIRLKSEGARLPPVSVKLSLGTHDLFMQYMGKLPALVPLIEGITFTQSDKADYVGTWNRFQRAAPDVNITPVRWAINMTDHVRKCTSRKTSGAVSDNAHSWTSTAFPSRSSLPLPNMEFSAESNEAPVDWWLQDAFGDVTDMAISSKWCAASLQVLQGDGVFVWPAKIPMVGDSVPKYRLALSSTYSVAFNPSGELLATGGVDDLRLWKLDEEKPPRSKVYGETCTWCIDWTWFGGYFCTGHDSKACLWSTTKATPIRIFPCQEGGMLGDAAVDVTKFHPTGSYIGIAGAGSVCMFDVRIAKPVRIWKPPRHYLNVTTLAFREDGMEMAVGFDSGAVARIELGKGMQYGEDETKDGAVWALAYDQDQKVVSGGDFGLSSTKEHDNKRVISLSVLRDTSLHVAGVLKPPPAPANPYIHL